MFFFFNDTATTEIYTLSLHDALPICANREIVIAVRGIVEPDRFDGRAQIGLDADLLQHRLDGLRPQLECRDVTHQEDRKSTRLNSSHANISYAVFCLKKKKIDLACTT